MSTLADWVHPDKETQERAHLSRLRVQHTTSREAVVHLRGVEATLITLLSHADDAVRIAAAWELRDVRERLEREIGKSDKIEREAVECEQRVTRWRLLRRAT